MDTAHLNRSVSRRSFVAGAGAVLASLSVPLLSGPAHAFAEGDAAADTSARIAIVHTNDVHCSAVNAKTGLGYAKLKSYVDAQRSIFGASNVILVDSGDHAQGEIMGTLSKGESPAALVNACGYDIITPGNHEFDYGIDKFNQFRATEANGTGLRYVSCNFVDGNGNRIFDAYRVVECAVAGQTVRVAYVGATTPETLSSSLPTTFKDGEGNYAYGFCGDASGQQLYDAIQAAVDEARDAGRADYVVLLAHLGQVGAIDRWRSDVVVANTTGIDVVADGHSHETYVQTVRNKNGQDVIITQTGTKFASFGRILIDPVVGTARVSITSTGVSAELIKSWDGSDAGVEAVVANVNEEVAKVAGTKVGISECDLYATEIDPSKGWAVRCRETNLGDFCADALLYFAANQGAVCDVALVNGGGVRANIKTGDITYGDLMAVNPTSNQICYLDVTGQQLLDMLEVGVRKAPAQFGSFPQVSEGFAYTVRTDIASPVKLDESGVVFRGIEGTRRVTSATLYGEPIDAGKTYKVVACNFLLVAGGDGMPIPQNANDAVALGLDVDALVEYVKTNLNGVIGAAYGNADGAGRITILDHAIDGSSDGDSAGSDGSADGDTDGSGAAAGSTTTRSNSAVGASAKASSAGKVSKRDLPATGDESVAAAMAASLAGLAALLGAANLRGEGE